jgi:hypothetical protein
MPVSEHETSDVRFGGALKRDVSNRPQEAGRRGYSRMVKTSNGSRVTNGMAPIQRMPRPPVASSRSDGTYG